MNKNFIVHLFFNQLMYKSLLAIFSIAFFCIGTSFALSASWDAAAICYYFSAGFAIFCIISFFLDRVILESRTNRLRPIGDIARRLAKKIIIHAYCNGWLSKSRTQKLFRDLDLGDC